MMILIHVLVLAGLAEHREGVARAVAFEKEDRMCQRRRQRVPTVGQRQSHVAKMTRHSCSIEVFGWAVGWVVFA